MEIIKTSRLCFSYRKEKPILQNLNISVKKGSITSFLGGNGAGKTTFFLNLNGVLTPDSGEIWIDGEKMEHSKKDLIKRRQKIGIVFQDPNDQLFSSSVQNDIAFGAFNLKLPKEEVKRRVTNAAKQTGILDLLNTPTHALSFGQKKRVAIAGVLAMKPEIIILDEPTAGLDPKGISELLHLMITLNRQEKITILLSTHDIDLVPLYCDYSYVLDHGKVVLSGTPKQLFQQKEILRSCSLRLPRMAHLMEILAKEDCLSVDPSASTIAQVRKEILKLR